MDENFAIQLFEGNKVRLVWDAEQEKYYFAVADIVQVLTDSTDVKQYIKRMRARDTELNFRWGTIVPLLECWLQMGSEKNDLQIQRTVGGATPGAEPGALAQLWQRG